MDQRGMVEIEEKIEDRSYRYYMPIGCNIPEAYNALVKITAGVAEMLKEAMAKVEQSHKDEKKSISEIVEEKAVEAVEENKEVPQ